MRINKTVVERVSDYAREVSGGVFGLQGVGSDIGHGVRYIDGRQQLVWLGRYGARRAAAYYYGVAEAYNAHAGRAIGDLPEWLRAVRAELVEDGRRAFVFEEITNGQCDANSRIHH